MQLAGKVVAITGGSAGIGRAIAEAFLAQGATVALFARNADKGARVAGGVDVAVIQHDMPRPPDPSRRPGIGLGQHRQQVALRRVV